MATPQESMNAEQALWHLINVYADVRRELTQNPTSDSWRLHFKGAKDELSTAIRTALAQQPDAVAPASWDHPANFTWPPCDPGCDRERNGEKDRYCDCEPAKERLAWLKAQRATLPLPKPEAGAGTQYKRVSDEESALIDEAVAAGRIKFSPGWNAATPSVPAVAPTEPEGWTLTQNLHTFLNAAAGEGLVLDGVDAADLYIAAFPAKYAAACASIDTGAAK